MVVATEHPGILQSLVAQLGYERIHPIPVASQAYFTPATHSLYEWQDYWLDLPGVDRLRVGQTWLEPTTKSLFDLRFDNRIGLTELQPYRAGKALASPDVVLVLSPKFPTPAEHLGFFRSLLDDLFTRATRLPFTVSSPTAQDVTEALRPPAPLFVLHFLCQYGATLHAALSIIQAFPHRLLMDDLVHVPIAEVDDVDADVVIDILHSPEHWVRSHSQVLVAEQMHGYAPTIVQQRRAEESYDTPENRFVKHFLQQLLLASDILPAQPWWENVPGERQQMVRWIATVVRQVLAHPMFTEVGLLHQLPFNSQVLLRREGYRDMLDLWQRFQQARRPLFAALQHAIEVHNIALLYEIWAYFALVEKIADELHLDAPPSIDLRINENEGLQEGVKAYFGDGRTLDYNRTFRHPKSYSVSLRPDFTWMCDGAPEVIFDAKFRLERPSEVAEDDTPSATAKRSDLYKMHTYRDALGVRAAVALYPGTEALFYSATHSVKSQVSLADIINGNVSGIGALPFKPGGL